MASEVSAAQSTKHQGRYDSYDETISTAETAFKPASNVTSSLTFSGNQNPIRSPASSDDDRTTCSRSQLSTTPLLRQIDASRQPVARHQQVTTDGTPAVAPVTTMSSTMPPPAPPLPPPATISASAASVLGSSRATMTVPRPRTQTKRFQWTKIPASRAACGSPTVWTVVGRMLGDSMGPADGGRCSPDFDCLEQLFSVQAVSTGGLLGGGTSPALSGLGVPPGSSGLLTNADGLTLDRRKKAEEVRLSRLQLKASPMFDRWLRASQL